MRRRFLLLVDMRLQVAPEGEPVEGFETVSADSDWLGSIAAWPPIQGAADALGNPYPSSDSPIRLGNRHCLDSQKEVVVLFHKEKPLLTAFMSRPGD